MRPFLQSLLTRPLPQESIGKFLIVLKVVVTCPFLQSVVPPAEQRFVDACYGAAVAFDSVQHNPDDVGDIAAGTDPGDDACATASNRRFV